MEVLFSVNNCNRKAFLDNLKDVKEWTSMLLAFEPKAKIIQIIEKKEFYNE